MGCAVRRRCPALDAGLPRLDAGVLPWLDAGLPRVRTWMRRQAHGEASRETGLDAQTLQAVQQPLKDTYRQDPQQAMITLTAQGELGAEDVSCSVATGQALAKAGLHPATGGDGSLACSGDMLLQALVACAGVTLRAVATSLKLPVRGGTVSAEGDLDFRGTLAVAKDAPVGFTAIRLSFSLDTDASAEELDTLLRLTRRYCVVYQTLAGPVELSETLAPRSKLAVRTLGAGPGPRG